jgi:hypothetical protein
MSGRGILSEPQSHKVLLAKNYRKMKVMKQQRENLRKEAGMLKSNGFLTQGETQKSESII